MYLKVKTFKNVKLENAESSMYFQNCFDANLQENTI